MKDTMNKLARGEFLYEIPQIVLTPTQIRQSIAVDTTTQCCIQVNSDSSLMKGVVYSDNARVVLGNNMFVGKDASISYTVQSAGLIPGEVLEGSFCFITNAGERIVPYSFKVTEKAVECSAGPAHNLFHFANLVQVSLEEAKKLFVSDSFEGIFLKNDLETCNIYHALCASADIDRSIEEFLIAVHKKQAVVLKILNKDGQECKTASAVYENLAENYHDSIVLRKNTWGYLNAPVVCDADFVQLEKNKLISADFAGNKYELGFVIHPDRLHAGHNYARVRIGIGEGSVCYEIAVVVAGNGTKGVPPVRILEQKTAVSITRNYIKFRSHNITLDEWAQVSIELLDEAVAQLPDKPEYKLMQAQIFCIQDKDDNAAWLLDMVKEDVLKDTDSIIYCYYLYVSSMYRKDTQYTEEVVRTLRKKYEYGLRDWRLLWMLFYVDDSYNRNLSIKLARIKELFHNGCHSPIMYFEACQIINSQPVFIRVFDEFERQVIYFGCKYNLITERTAGQICDISRSERNVTGIYLRIIQDLYDKYRNDEMLTTLCEHLIRNQERGAKVFDVYETCILRGLCITGIYEFYMDCVPADYDHLFPKMLLMYFSYNNMLDPIRKAYLYANIIRYMPQEDELWTVYIRQMELFAIEQLQEGQISDNLVLLYRELWDEALINDNTANAVARLLFAYKLTCYEPGIERVIVRHKELDTEMIVPLIDSVAYVSIYTEKSSIVFEDAGGQRFKDTIAYELERLMEEPQLADTVYSYIPNDIYLQIYRYEKGEGDGCELCRLLESPILALPFRKKVQSELIRYYCEEYTGEDITPVLDSLQNTVLQEQQATQMIELCIAKGLYAQAYTYALSYGIRKVSVGKLYRLCRYLIENDIDSAGGFLTQMCSQVYVGGQYDPKMLAYLQEHYNGTTQQMCDLWETCKGFDVDSYSLKERIITQILFTNTRNDKLFPIFDEYYEAGANERILEAYLSYESYEYFIRGNQTDSSIFKIIESRMEYNDDVSDLCKLALLLYYSRRKEFDKSTAARSMDILALFAGRDILFAFFKDLADKVALPYKAVDKTIIEYRANPDSKVILHYKLGADGSSADFIKEVLPNTFMGIFTKAFTLFYGDTLQYYFTENVAGEEKVTEPVSITCKNVDDAARGRYAYLNDMLESRETHDLVTLDKLMHEYVVEDYITRQMFKMK